VLSELEFGRLLHMGALEVSHKVIILIHSLVR